MCYEIIKEYQLGLKIYDELVTIYKTTLGNNHPNTSEINTRIGFCYLGNYLIWCSCNNNLKILN